MQTGTEIGYYQMERAMRLMKMMMISGVAATLGMGTAHATAVVGTGTFVDSGPIFNGVSFSGIVADINSNLVLNTPVTINDLLTITASSNPFFGNATDAVEAEFNFTSPSGAMGSVSGAGTSTVTALGFVDNGQITWSNPGVVTFIDGAILDITLADTTFDLNFFNGYCNTANVNATLTLIQDPTSVPEPGSLLLLGTGLLGLSLVIRKTRTHA